jgi:5'/3'-nucleotidase SurE
LKAAGQRMADPVYDKFPKQISIFIVTVGGTLDSDSYPCAIAGNGAARREPCPQPQPTTIQNRAYDMTIKRFAPPLIAALPLALSLAMPAQALNILLVNDDGCMFQGINTLMTRLETAGHTVTMIAPAGNQSGKGTVQHFYGSTTAVQFTVSRTSIDNQTTSDDNRKCVTATVTDSSGTSPVTTVESASPVDSVRVALVTDFASTKPDLVISGINEGENNGIISLSSGTVSAATWAIREGVPAIAVSAAKNIFASEDYGAIADFTVEVVAELIAKRRSNNVPLLPEGMGLNINYPSTQMLTQWGITGGIKGIRYTQIKKFTTADIGPRNENGTVTSGININAFLNGPLVTAGIAIGEEDPTDEGQSLGAGYITISIIDGDQNAAARKQALARIKLRDLAL